MVDVHRHGGAAVRAEEVVHHHPLAPAVVAERGTPPARPPHRQAELHQLRQQRLPPGGGAPGEDHVGPELPAGAERAVHRGVAGRRQPVRRLAPPLGQQAGHVRAAGEHAVVRLRLLPEGLRRFEPVGKPGHPARGAARPERGDRVRAERLLPGHQHEVGPGGVERAAEPGPEVAPPEEAGEEPALAAGVHVMDGPAEALEGAPAERRVGVEPRVGGRDEERHARGGGRRHPATAPAGAWNWRS